VSSVAEERIALHDRLVAFLEAQETDVAKPLTDRTSLMKSGLLDSLSVFNLTTWVERETGREKSIRRRSTSPRSGTRSIRSSASSRAGARGTPARSIVLPYATDLVTRPDHRNRGLITTILRSPFKELAARGYQYVINLSASPMTVAVSLLLGWRNAGDTGLMVRRRWGWFA
jgi:hypothetical protein